MKKENIINISENGIVTIPNEVKMQEFEIAELFGVKYQTVRNCIKNILKSNMCYGDYSQSGVVYGNTIYPEYYDLSFILAIAFRVHSLNAKLFREYILRKLTAPTTQPLFFQIGNANRDSIYN